MADHVMVWPCFVSETVAASGSATSPVKNLDELQINGFFSLQISLSGDGTAKFQWGVSNDKSNFIYSADAGDNIVTAFVKTSGPGSDGKNIYSFDPIVAKYLTIKVTETGGANNVTVSAWCAIH
jgi:hypothetical protein